MGYLGWRGSMWSRNSLVLAVTLLSTGLASHAQKNGVAFWEPDPSKVNSALLARPKNDAERFSFLHGTFLDFRCNEWLEEQQAGKGSQNLICKLPGKSPATILILARYDKRDADRPTWPDALMLPLLFHALRAQPRQHTFVFAALAGSDGEKRFFDAQRRDREQTPIATIVLDSLGMGLPNIYTGNGVLYQQAQRTASLLGIVVPMHRPGDAWDNLAIGDYYGLQWHNRILDSSLLKNARAAPTIGFYSEPSSPVNAPAFHRDFDFVAWFLCGLDVTVQAAEQAGSH